jgi:ribonuclease HI
MHGAGPLSAGTPSTTWRSGWIERGWRKASKHPVKNADLWQELIAAVERHTSVLWTWTRGHAGNHFNEIADEHAQRQAGTFVS